MKSHRCLVYIARLYYNYKKEFTVERVGLTPEDIKAKNIAFYEDMISNREKYIKRMKRRDGDILSYRF